MARSLKKHVRELLDQGLTAEEAWRAAEAVRYAPWGYVRKIARDYEKEKTQWESTQECSR